MIDMAPVRSPSRRAGGAGSSSRGKAATIGRTHNPGRYHTGLTSPAANPGGGFRQHHRKEAS